MTKENEQRGLFETTSETPSPRRRRRKPAPPPARRSPAPAPLAEPGPEAPPSPDSGWGEEAPPEEPRRTVQTVSQIVRAARDQIESGFGDVWVEGEVSGFRRHTSGHCYFSLKDAKAVLDVALFRGVAAALRFRLEDGMQILLRGRLTLYEARGKFQMIAEYAEPVGIGSLHLAFEQLKKKLEGEGLFATGRKRPLPLLPRRIGLVTSPTGAAVRDVLKIINARFANVDVLIYPALVQGKGAAGQIAAGVRYLDGRGDIDVMIIGRGGGSLEDLWCFNEEEVARAVAAARVPVISAVGHERDFTIADFVADVRAATPSNAAEIVLERKDALEQAIREYTRRIAHAQERRLDGVRLHLTHLTRSRAFQRVVGNVEQAGQRLDDLALRLDLAARRTLAVRQERCQALVRRLSPHSLLAGVAARRDRLAVQRDALRAVITHGRRRWEAALEGLMRVLHDLSPLAVLERGYSITFQADSGTVVKEAAQVRPGEGVRVRLHRGRLSCTVTGTEDDGEEADL